MTSIFNSGMCIFGSDPDAAQGAPDQPAPGAKFPPSGARCIVTAKYKGGTKIEKAKASGKSGAKQTTTGAKVAEVDIEITYPDVEPTATLMEQALLTISPHGPNGEKAWDWTERRAMLFNVGAVLVEDFEVSEDKGSDQVTVKMKLSGWDKGAQSNSGAGNGTTPDAASPYTVHGGALDGFTFPAKPTVSPT